MGNERQKIEAVRTLFERQDELPKQSVELVLKLADPCQPQAVRLTVAEMLRGSRYSSDRSFIEILKVLTDDPDPQIKAASDELRRQIMQPMAEVFESIGKIAQSITLPQFELPTSVLKQVQENLAELTKQVLIPQLTAMDLIGALDIMGRVNETVVQAMQPLLSSYYPQRQLEVIGAIYPGFEKEEWSHAANLGSKLVKCHPGKNWKEYQTLCREILTHTLVPTLLEPREEVSTRDGTQRRDLIFHIPFDAGGFWKWIAWNHKSIAMIVDCKNYSEPLGPEEVTLTAKYLEERRLGLFAVIACRKGFSQSARREQERLWTVERKMILPLTDDDLVRMLRLKEAGDDPSKVIDHAIRAFRQAL